MGWEWSFTFMPYGNRWREQRRLFVNNYHGGMVEHKVPAFEESQKLLVSLLNNPKDFSHHLKTYVHPIYLSVCVTKWDVKQLHRWAHNQTHVRGSKSCIVHTVISQL
jgi:hypothetical protein